MFITINLLHIISYTQSAKKFTIEHKSAASLHLQIEYLKSIAICTYIEQQK